MLDHDDRHLAPHEPREPDVLTILLVLFGVVLLIAVYAHTIGEWPF